MKTIYITVRGGMVEEVFTDGDDAIVEIIYFDTNGDEEAEEEAEEMYEEASKHKSIY